MVKNVTLFDGEKVLDNRSVLVEDGKITKINAVINFEGETIDGTGKFLMPAMTNSHVHAFMAPNLIEAAQAGVLNVLDMHGMEEYQPIMQKNAAKAPNFARFYFAGAAATAPDGHGTQFGFPSPTLSTVEEASNFIDARLNAGASYIKIIVEPWKNTLSHEVVKALIDVAHAKDKIAVVHISKLDDAIKVLENDADGLVHIWWDKEIDAEQLKSLSEKEQFFVIPTLLTSHLVLDQLRKLDTGQTFISNEKVSMEVKRLYDAGVPILAGTDPPNANINYGTDLYKELDLLSKAGIPNLDVLKSATSNPATFFDLKKTGYIKEGYFADLILLNGDPIKDIQNISAIEKIWKEGNVVSSEQ